MQGPSPDARIATFLDRDLLTGGYSVGVSSMSISSPNLAHSGMLVTGSFQVGLSNGLVFNPARSKSA